MLLQAVATWEERVSEFLLLCFAGRRGYSHMSRQVKSSFASGDGGVQGTNNYSMQLTTVTS